MTLGTWLNKWLAQRAPLIKPLTRESYEDLIARYVTPAIGHIPTDELESEHIRTLLDEIVTSGHTRTAEMVWVMLRTALRDLPARPMDAVRRPHHVQHSPNPWTDDQIAVYIAALPSVRQGAGLALGIMLGLRRGEICGLRWKDVDLDARILHVCNQRVVLANGQIIDQSPKSRASDRILPITDALYDVLRASYRPEAVYVCPISPHALDRAHSRLVARLGLPHIPLHGLRHSLATSIYRNGGDLRTIQSLLGHSSYAVTAQIYAHPNLDVMLSSLLLPLKYVTITSGSRYCLVYT